MIGSYLPSQDTVVSACCCVSLYLHGRYNTMSLLLLFFTLSNHHFCTVFVTSGLLWSYLFFIRSDSFAPGDKN
jgi:hypothetical protein